jgi:hypothetical protein
MTKPYGGWYGVFYGDRDDPRPWLMCVFNTRAAADKYVVKAIKELPDGHESEWSKYVIKRVKITL